MFWKKKSEEEPKKLFKAPEQSRGAFRISPDPEEPIAMKFNKVDVNVIDISSGGASFKNANFKENTLYDVVINLPHSAVTITAKMKILRIKEDQTCPAVFVDLAPEFEDEICQYVLLRQKEELKRRKNIYT